MKRNNKNEKIFKMSKKQKYIYCKDELYEKIRTTKNLIKRVGG